MYAMHTSWRNVTQVTDCSRGVREQSAAIRQVAFVVIAVRDWFGKLSIQLSAAGLPVDVP
jgi:hypothetical protein